MVLDEQIMRLDNYGIFPMSLEKEADFLERGKRVLSWSDVSDSLTYMQKVLFEDGFHGEVFLPNSRDKIKITSCVKRIKNKYQCDLSWVPIVYTDMGFGDGLPKGLTYSDVVNVDKYGKIKEVQPPFIVINSAFATKGLYTHELLHITNLLSKTTSITYPGHESYSERIANQGSHLKHLSSNITHPVINFQFNIIKTRLALNLGIKAANYVMPRLNYEEAKDFFYDKIISKDPKETICKCAENNNLRYKIIKERLEL
jgi:hypothetical protein